MTKYYTMVPDYLKSITGETQFQGIDRSHMKGKMSEQIEILISKKDCSPIVAMELLNLALMGRVRKSPISKAMSFTIEYIPRE